MPQEPSRWELRITATGEVRDADGNLLNTPTAESTYIVSDEEARAIIERQAQQ